MKTPLLTLPPALRVAPLIGILAFACPVLQAADSSGLPPANPLRVAVLGSPSGTGDASAAIAALVNADRERGITINTSHVEYQTVNRSNRAEFTQAAAAQHFGAAVLVGSGPDPSEVLEAANLTRVLGIRPVYVLLAGGPYRDEQLAALQKSLFAMGYTADTCGIYAGNLDGPPSPPNPVVVDLRDDLEKSYRHPDPSAAFSLAVDETLDSSNGLVSYGLIAAGSVQTGDLVEIVGFSPRPIQSTVTGVEMFRKLLDRGQAGDNVGLLLRGIDKKDIRRGMVIVKPGSATAHSKVKAEVYVLKKEEGGRHTPFHNKYRPQFYFRGTDVTGEIELPDGRGLVMPGDNVTISVNLINPIAMDKGLRFAIREGGRTVGAGQVTEIVK